MSHQGPSAQEPVQSPCSTRQEKDLCVYPKAGNKSTTLQFLKFLKKERQVRREWILTVTAGTVVRETPI